MSISALRVGPDATARLVEWSGAVAHDRQSPDPLWVHLTDGDPEEVVEILGSQFGFHPLAVQDAVGKEERPELKEFEDHFFLVAPCVVGNGADGSERFEELGLFVSGSLLVTVSACEVPSITRRMDEWCKRGSVPRPEVGYLLYSLLDAALDDFFPCLDALEDKVDEVADSVFEGSTEHVRDLMVLKRRMLQLRRRVGPFRDVLNSLLRREADFVTPGVQAYYHDLFDNALRLTELIDTNRDALTGLADIHLSTVSNRLNEVMRKMTVISTLLMTAALIAGIYGMNLRIPEAEWVYGYPFALGLMALASLVLLGLFRRQKWI